MAKKEPKNKYIQIYLGIYKVTVLVTWEQDITKIIKYARKRGVKISDKWETSFSECRVNAIGVCLTLGDNNTDVLVWLKKRPVLASEYGVLYHELSHALDHISESHNLGNETEAKAYIYEYLATQCNTILWNYK